YYPAWQHQNSDERAHMTENDTASSSVQRAFAIIRALADTQAKGGRVTHVAKATGLTQATTHRLLQSLVGERVVEQDEQSKLYRLSIDFFALAIRWICAHYAARRCCGYARASATPSSCWCAAASMLSAWTAAKGRSRSARSPETS